MVGAKPLRGAPRAMVKIELLERERELAAVGESVERARDGGGSVLLIEGPAGIGKTTLLEEARRSARSAGLDVLFARGGELERDFPFSVVRQLFEAPLREQPTRRRRELLRGAAELAAPLVAPQTASAIGETYSDRSFAVLHGLYWLTANMAASTPLALVVDDAHWADTPSLRFLGYLARRLEGLAVFLLLAARSGEEEKSSALLAEPDLTVVRPGPFSEAAVAHILCARLNEPPHEQFTVSCHGATGGNPFLLGELVTALAADGVRPTAEQSDQVVELGPSTVAHATLLRLGRLPEAATSLAQAVAVLGTHARLDRAARLAGIDEAEALRLLDALAATQILSAAQPLEFVHPIVRAAIYEDLPPGQRSATHAHAAQLLAREDADIDAVGSQLLVSAPAGRTEVVEQLRAAAASAVARGAPENAVVYLHRALEEGIGSRQARAGLLYELGMVEKLMRDPGAIGRFEQALLLEHDRVRRGRIALDLAEIFAMTGQWEEVPALLDPALAELGELDRELALRIQAQGAAYSAYNPTQVARFNRRLASLQAAAGGQETGARELSLLLAAILAFRGAQATDVRALLDHGLAGGEFLARGGAESWALAQAFGALTAIDELEGALSLAADTLTTARQIGSLLGFLLGLAHRAWAEVRRGNLVDAEADLRASLEGAQEHGLQMAATITLWFGMDAIIERPQLADVAAIVETLDPPPALATTFTGAALLELRGRLHLMAGETAEATDDLRASGETSERLGFFNPNLCGWRSPLALALAVEDPSGARALVDAERADAERIRLPRGIGVALRTTGVLEGGDRGIELLREAVDVLGRSPARLEHARALVELGAALRRANQRAAAREPLRAGLDAAIGCGATRLGEHARTELAATGAKPRRLRITGRDALTPSEQRIARMAADGLQNREIAQALFVTAKTVENHLGHIYQKLGITGRDALADALERQQTVV